MSNAPFAPCPSCSRHVRVDAERCPFCTLDLSDASLDPVPDIGARRLGRAALFAFATGVAAVSCNSTQRPDNGGSVPIMQPYGAPPDPRPRDAGPSPLDPGLVVAIYGAPAPPADAATPDAGAPDAAPPTDASAPPTPDAGRPPRPPRPPSNGGGPPMVRYGAPPPPDDL